MIKRSANTYFVWLDWRVDSGFVILTMEVRHNYIQYPITSSGIGYHVHQVKEGATQLANIQVIDVSSKKHSRTRICCSKPVQVKLNVFDELLIKS